MPEPSRYVPIPEAMVMRFFNSVHRQLNIFTTPQTLTPSAGKRIAVSFIQLQTDMGAGTVVITCTGVDTVTFRAGGLYPLNQGPDGVYIGATDQAITFTKGGVGGGYSEVWLVYYEL